MKIQVKILKERNCQAAPRLRGDYWEKYGSGRAAMNADGEMAYMTISKKDKLII